MIETATDRRTRHQGATPQPFQVIERCREECGRQEIRGGRKVALEERMDRLTRHRLVEIGVAVGLTMAALLFVAYAAWAEPRVAEPQGTQPGVTEPGGVTVTDAWARPTVGDLRVSAAYMTVANAGGEDDRLKAARTPRAKRVELHVTQMSDDGVMKMRPIKDGLPVPAGGTAILEPGGAHVMLMGLDGALAEGEDLPLTLEFEKAGGVEISVPVRKQAGAN